MTFNKPTDVDKPTAVYNSAQRKLLLTTASAAIKAGFDTQSPMQIAVVEYEPLLQQQRACFVTLQIQGKLRGCIGSLVAHRPLIADVVHNAYAAAFNDSRFAPLTSAEFPLIDLHISVLSPTEKLHFSTEADLISKIRPNIDGLILSSGSHRGTFLPSVWEQIPDPKDFLQHLKNKAGLPSSFWADDVQIERYTTEMFN